MKVIIINGSPKGKYSVTLQTVLYLQKKYPEHEFEVSVTICDDEYIHELNKEYRGIDRTTDVLSFALNDNKHIDAVLNSLGDIFISIPNFEALKYLLLI